MQKVVEKFLTGPQHINILVIEFKKIGVVSIGTFSIFEKIDFSFYSSYFHMKILPPMNTSLSRNGRHYWRLYAMEILSASDACEV